MSAAVFGQAWAVLDRYANWPAAAVYAEAARQASTSPLGLIPWLPLLSADGHEAMTPILGALAEFPSQPYTAAEQAEFWAGYYDLLVRLTPPAPDEPNNARLEIRMPETMKSWLLAHGGAATVRMLIARAMAQDTGA